MTEHVSSKKQKLVDIHQALNSDPVDIETLRRAAISEGGLLTDDVRRKVWPKLLSINVFDLPPKPGKCVVYSVLQQELIMIVNTVKVFRSCVSFVLAISCPSKGKNIRENHKDYNQVLLDVRRSMRRFPRGNLSLSLIRKFDLPLLTLETAQGY